MNEENKIIQQCAEAVQEAYAKIANAQISLSGAKEAKASFASFLQDYAQPANETVVLVYFMIYAEKENIPVGYSVIEFTTKDSAALADDERSRLAEIGNMLIGAYLSSYSNLVSKNLRSSIQPVFKSSRDEAAKVLQNQLFKGDIEQEVSFVRIQLNGVDNPALHVFLLPETVVKKDEAPPVPATHKEIMVGKTNVTQLLQEKFKKLDKGWITLIQVPIERTMEVNIEGIRVLQLLGYEGIYITLSKDYVELAKMFQGKGIDMGKLAFIDGISQMYGIDKVDSPNVTYVDGPLSVDDISEHVTKIAPTMKSEKKFVFLDSITTVLLYNSLERTLQFSRFLTESLKKMQVVGIVVSVSKGFANENLIKELTKISNEVINLQTKSD